MRYAAIPVTAEGEGLWARFIPHVIRLLRERCGAGPIGTSSYVLGRSGGSASTDQAAFFMLRFVLSFEQRVVTMRKLILVVLMFGSGGLQAHHSRANFNNDIDLELTGTVVDFSWRNPHVYVEIAVEDEAGETNTWLVEAHSVTGMKNKGWDKNTLVEGSTVTIGGHPDRNTDRHFLLMSYIQKPGEEKLLAFNRTPTPKSEIEASIDFSGTWDLDFSRFNVKEAGGGPPDWSYTDAGKAQVEKFSVNNNPELTCQQIGVPKLVIYPYGINWTRKGDVILIQKEHMDEDRVIYLNPHVMATMQLSPTYVGTSYGRFESERHLKVLTVGFLPTPWGNANGIDSSEQKRVIEDYVLSEDGMSVEISYTIEDPVYMTESVTVTGGYFKAKNRPFEKLGCDEHAASRHLEAK